MRVLFDATMIKQGQGGIRSYARGLARALAERGGLDIVVCAPPWETDWFGLETIVVGIRSGDPVGRSVWRARHIPGLAARMHTDLVFVPSHESVPGVPVPQVFVVHDIGPLVAPALYGVPRFVRYAATLRGALNRVEAAVCVSTATKLDVVRFLGGDPRRLHVIGQGPQPFAGVVPARQPAAGPDAYALYVGASLRHKNLDVLVEAFRDPAPGMPPNLLLVGPEYAHEVRELRGRIGDAINIEHRGFVGLPELQDAYAGAACLVFPSLHEGFGIPLIEAMERSVPIVASDIPALREVGGDAVHWVPDPVDPGAWRSAVAAVASSDVLRRQLAAGVPARLRAHNWADVADQMVELWEASRS